jgi:hypothetical protein
MISPGEPRLQVSNGSDDFPSDRRAIYPGRTS